MSTASGPPLDGATEEVAPHRSDRSPWNWLLLVGIVLPLLVPLYNRVEPILFGWPFFYWFQLLLVGVGVLVTSTVAQSAGEGATIVVSTTDDVVEDDGLCSLREAITSANDDVAPFPGAGPGCQPADCPAGTPCDPSCHVHGSVRRRETATSTRPDRSRCSTSAATGSQGHSVAKCPTSQSAGPLDSIASETG